MSKESLKKKVLDDRVLNEMVETTFANADLNKNSIIERNELAILLKSIYGTLGLRPPKESEIDQELRRLDKNRDGKLSKAEFKILVRDLALFSIENLIFLKSLNFDKLLFSCFLIESNITGLLLIKSFIIFSDIILFL